MGSGDEFHTVLYAMRWWRYRHIATAYLPKLFLYYILYLSYNI